MNKHSISTLSIQMIFKKTQQFLVSVIIVIVKIHLQPNIVQSVDLLYCITVFFNFSILTFVCVDGWVGWWLHVYPYVEFY